MDPAGLSAEQAARQLQADGHNDVPSAERREYWRIALEMLCQPMFAMLIGGGLIYLLLGDPIEALLLMVFAGLSIAIGLIQTSRSERVLQALRTLASPRAGVIRDGTRQLIPGRDVVRGDLLLVAEGDRVAADADLLEAQDLLIDESLLTGESVAVTKRAPTPDDRPSAGPATDDAAAALRLQAGTLVVRGSGLARVTATGAHSQIGSIGRDLQDIRTGQPRLQQQIRWLVRDFALAGAVVGVGVVLLQGLVHGSWLQALLSGIAVGMSLLPEEFALVLAVFTAMGAWRISRARVLTRRASAIETLGATTVLCTDKTGTLTENRMRVASLGAGGAQWDGGALSDAALIGLLGVARLACEPRPTDPMDLAIHALSDAHAQAGAVPAAPGERLRSYGLRPDLFAVANVFAGPGAGTATACAKGAPEAIGELCRMDASQLAQIRAQADVLAHRGIRVLGVASARVARPADASAWPGSLREIPFTFAGLIGFADPLRANVPDAIAECREAGIRVLMITGDYPVTAAAIARQAGLDADRVLTGDELASLSDEQLVAELRKVSVFARVRPAQKLRIVQSLQAGGAVVAMTGDGVNDAPAIKAADIGVAMGGRGTEVAREASSIVLLDDDFGSIVKTIRLGRRIHDNLRKAIEYIVAVHIPLAGMAVLPLLFGMPMLLTPVLIAFMEMVIDPACSVVFEAEPEEDDVMRRPPRDPGLPLLQARRVMWAVLQGVVALGLVSATLIVAARMGLAEDDLRALVFTALVLINVGLILVNRSLSGPLLSSLRHRNRPLWVLLGGVTGIMLIVMVWPAARELFGLGQPHAGILAACALVGVLSLLLLEALKAVWFHVRVPTAGSARPAG